MKFSRIAMAGGVFAVAMTLVAPTALANSGGDVGGWDELTGPFVEHAGENPWDAAQDGLQPQATKAKHRGEAETRTINGTTHKRAKGWTTWVGVYHYTRARMETNVWGKHAVLTDSGRSWGRSGTSAFSPWSRAYLDRDETPGSARTYYGR